MKYIDSFMVPIKPSRKADYLKVAEITSKILLENGAIRVVETWQDPGAQDPASFHATGTQIKQPTGENEYKTFNNAAGTKDDEIVVLSWVEWPDKATRDKGLPKAMADPRMHDFGSADEAFESHRLIAGGFEVILEG